MSAVVSMPMVRPVVGRRSVAARRRDDLLGRVHLAVRMARRTLKAAVAAEEEGLLAEGGREASKGPVAPAAPAALVLGKVVGEAAMLLRTTAPLRGEDETLDVESRLLAVQLVAQARGARVRERLCNDAGRALEHASAHLFLGDAGYPDEAFDRLLDDILDGEDACGPERLPNHQLECAWLDQIRRGRVEVEPIDEELLVATCIGWPLDVLGCSTLDLYMFTHVVMYASDMGRRAVHPPRPVEDILAEAEAGLAAALDADNFDLAAELLWTWPMLRQRWSAAAVFALELLMRVQDEHAFLPGPDYARWAGRSGGGLAHEDVVQRTSYHANLVMGMLCAVALQTEGRGFPSRRGSRPGISVRWRSPLARGRGPSAICSSVCPPGRSCRGGSVPLRHSMSTSAPRSRRCASAPGSAGRRPPTTFRDCAKPWLRRWNTTTATDRRRIRRCGVSSASRPSVAFKRKRWPRADPRPSPRPSPAVREREQEAQ
ncbi:DUF6895 family protein [Roseateles chitinivorans]|uniref:DUF6895 family protein n=1 Tax=Roseateles chitinivorans TaxID=2917965 RepID=UPI003D6787B9